jgi:hypothetical protein
MLSTDLFGQDTMHRDATFACDGQRLTLTRRWGEGPRACMIGCNPSRADARRDDPTCLWWINWSQLFGYGRFDAVNMYPFCTASPAECRKIADWENNGPDWHARDALQYNLDVVVRTAKAADIVIACWGAIAWDDAWIEHVVEQIQSGEAPWPDLYCFGMTASGAPKHPMARGVHRIPRDQKPILWRAA